MGEVLKKVNRLKRIVVFQYFFCVFDLLVSLAATKVNPVIISNLVGSKRIGFIFDIFPATWRLGRLAENKLVGEFSLAIAMIGAIPFFISVFLYFFLQKTTAEALASYEIAREKNPAQSFFWDGFS